MYESQRYLYFQWVPLLIMPRWDIQQSVAQSSQHEDRGGNHADRTTDYQCLEQAGTAPCLLLYCSQHLPASGAFWNPGKSLPNIPFIQGRKSDCGPHKRNHFSWDVSSVYYQQESVHLKIRKLNKEGWGGEELVPPDSLAFHFLLIHNLTLG